MSGVSLKLSYITIALSVLILSVLALYANAKTLWSSQDPKSRARTTPILQQQNPEGILSASQPPIESLFNIDGSCIPAWEAEPSPQLSHNTMLEGVAVVAPDDVWAVGHYRPDDHSAVRTQIIHWDGEQWTIVPSPNAPSSGNYLLDIAAVAPDDIWAVGYSVSGNLARTLILHWDGTSWSIATGANFGSGNNALSGVAFSAVNNGWAIGDYDYPVSRPLILHWDGSIWSVVSHPNPPAYSILNGVYATSTISVWAVGYYVEGYTASTLVMHWDGSSWSIVQSPNNPNVSENILEGVAAVNANDAWAVGGGGDAPYPLIMHWNGNEWEKSLSTIRGRLYGITSVASNDVWAVGDNNGSDTLIIHWDGESWSRVYSPNPGILSHTLRAVNGTTSNNVWAVGASSWTGDSAQTLTEHYTGQCVTTTPTATATPTQPTATPTSTPLPPTTTQTTTPSATYTFTSTPSRPTTTPTVCATTFTDVPFGSTFYSYIRCLACRGIINGYPDNTFHPNNNVTRGQLAKIVSNAAGFTDPPGSQLFEDVLPGSVFYEYIQRLASRGYMSGYPCGSPGEPCGGNNLPYFRPGNNATRGQISKIASNAAGFSEEHNVQMYEDILLGSPFYTFTARLTARNIISGYLCGGVGEPCGSANLPYFRPGNNATRGQTSKIAANTFFPTCQTPFR